MEQSNKQKEEENNNNNQEQQFQCVICYELPKLPVKSQCCGQLTCQMHIFGFKNKCPMCRQKPFKFEKNDDLNKEIMKSRIQELKEKNQDKSLSCQVQNCTFEGKYEDMVNHVQNSHNMNIGKILEKRDYNLYLKEKEKFEEMKRRNPPYGNRKDATQQQVIAMRQHTQTCENEKCHSLWQGPWGPFIGGQMGRTHFDLTECEIGRQMNEQINWNYENPAY